MYNPLVVLGLGGECNGGSVFCFPGAGDSVTSFVHLANAMTFGMPIYGLQPKGFFEGQEPCRSVEAMADEYCESIRDKLGSSKAYLIGHSFGGYVAMRVAQKLSLDRSVGTLVLLDAQAPQKFKVKSREESLCELIKLFGLGGRKRLPVSCDVLSDLTDSEQLELVQSIMKESGIVSKKMDLGEVKRIVELFLINSNMAYSPEAPYEGDALLIDAVEKDGSVQERSLNYSEWRLLAPQLKYTETAGNHVTMLEAGNVSILANILKRAWCL